MPLDDRISLHKLEVFSTVVRHGSITRAAEELMVAQPVVSAHIRSLEERLGVKLFDRSGRLIQLTEAGEIVHEWAIEVLTRSRELSRTIQGLADGTGGSVVIAASQTAGAYLLPPLVIDFKHDHPDADITLNVAEPEGALEATERGDCDFAVVTIEEGDSRKTLAYEHLRHEDLVLVGTADGPISAESVGVADLAYLPFVCSPVERKRRRMIDRMLARHGIQRRHVVLQLGNAEAIKQGVRAGLGVALCFRASVQAELERGDLTELVIEDAVLSAPMMLVQRRDKRLSALQRALRGVVATRLSTGQGVPVAQAAEG